MGVYGDNMGKKLIKGKKPTDKGKTQSHAGGDSRPLKNDVVRENDKWVRKTTVMENR